MSLLGWLKIKSRGTVVSKEKEISRALKETMKKTKTRGGDPFSEYRQRKILPDKYEYGMNCMVDRLFEQEGEEVAQKMYEELKNMGGCKIAQGKSTVDIARVPILFGVKSLAIGVEAHNRAADDILRREEPPGSYKLTPNKLLSLLIKNSETEHESIWKLTAMSAGLMTAFAWGAKGWSSSEKRKLKLWGKAIEQVVVSEPAAHGVILSDYETDALLIAADQGVARILMCKNPKTSTDDRLLLLCSHFWSLLAGSMVFEFPTEIKDPSKHNPWDIIYNALPSYIVDNNQIEKWKEHIRSANTPENCKTEILDQIWRGITEIAINKQESMEKYEPDFKDQRGAIVPIILMYVFLTVLGYEEPIMKSLLTIDKSISKFIFYKFVEEYTYRREWYMGD